ncbi:MAG TPA: outer membrane lipoprotein-sorting protein [Phycisphaerae bacterium]|nr:outer membrane lipoprotein-sorting protein [Phycisphaerae bacterium]
MTSGNRKSFVAMGQTGCAYVAVLIMAFGAVVLTRPVPAWAGDEEPTVEAVMAKYIEALGGKAALEKIHNRVTKADMEVSPPGMTMKVTAWEAAPNLSYVLVESESMGRIEEGTDGKVSWSNHPMMGAKVREGAELDRALKDATFNSDLKWRELYKTVELAGTEEMEGKPCYKIVATPEDGQPETWYVDKESSLKIKVQRIMEGPMGQVPITTTIGDFKKVDGVMIAYKTVQEVASMQKAVVTLTSVEHNVDLPKDRFALPEEIRSLIELQKESAAEEAKETE